MKCRKCGEEKELLKFGVAISILVFLILLIPVVLRIYIGDYYSNDFHSYTKAICSDNNYCIDVIISCSRDRVIDVKPITEGMYIDSDLVNEYRNQTKNEKWCN
jgi:hypothetical protein